jgi:hypothetical protein
MMVTFSAPAGACPDARIVEDPFAVGVKLSKESCRTWRIRLPVWFGVTASWQEVPVCPLFAVAPIVVPVATPVNSQMLAKMPVTAADPVTVIAPVPALPGLTSQIDSS